MHILMLIIIIIIIIIIIDFFFLLWLHNFSMYNIFIIIQWTIMQPDNTVNQVIL